MPKVISRYTVSSSESNKPAKSSRAVLRSYYCLCGDFTLVIQGKLDRLPRRESDGSVIVRSKDKDAKTPGRKFKLNAVAGDRFLLQHKEGKMEIRQPFLCSRCGVTVAYQSTPPPAGSGAFLYIPKGAMTEQQGRIPDDAFEGEEGTYDADDLANELFASPPPERDGELEVTNVEAVEDAEVGDKRLEGENVVMPLQSGSLPERLPEPHLPLVDRVSTDPAP